MDRLAALTAFCQVAEYKSFSQAAKRLEISVARISKLVAQLESHLNVRLLERTTRQVRVTEAGQLYYERCRPLLDELNDADANVSNLSQEIRGRLRISAPEDFGLGHLAGKMPLLLARYPNLTVEVQYANRFVDLHSEGVDVAIRIGRLQDSSLIARRLAPIKLLTCASPDYLKRFGTPRHPGELARHNCLIYTHAANPNLWRYQVDGQWHEQRVSGNMRSNNGLAMTTAAREGLGIIHKPSFMVAEHLRSGSLQAILTDFPSLETHMYAVYPHRRSLSAKISLFIDFLTEQFGDPPYWEQDLFGTEQQQAVKKNA